MTSPGPLIGHEEVMARLRQLQRDDRVSHAYVFCGKKGIGKTTAALTFAQELTGNSPADITVVTNEAYRIKAAALSVDAVRAARAEMFVKPYAADRRVFIFPQADTMTIAAQNALLKVLEEPPSYCVIILIAQNDRLLLPTIRSRAVSIRFAPLTDEQVRQYVETQGLTPSEQIIRLAQGSIERAMTLSADPALEELLQRLSQLAGKLTQPGKEPAYRLIQLFEGEKPHGDVLLDGLLQLFRASLLNNGAKRDTMAAVPVSAKEAAAAIEQIETCRIALAANANYGMAVSELFLNIWEAIHG